MKTPFYIFLLFTILFCNCSRQTQNDNSITTFYLEDSLYKISFIKPSELDTFYSWLNTNDHRCDDMNMYRFSNHLFPVQKENDYLDTTYADSMQRMTFVHIAKYNCKTNISKSAHEYLLMSIDEAKLTGSTIDTISSQDNKVGNLMFNFWSYKISENLYSNRWKYCLYAITTLMVIQL